jgi:response regulator NasT
MPPAESLRVLLVDDSEERASILRAGLMQAGHEVAAVISSPFDLLQAIESVKPDMIVIDTESPSRDVVENLFAVTRSNPRPIVMFSHDSATESIRAAVRAGVSAYVVDGLEAARVKPILEAAVARFEAFQSLRDQLAEANLKLEERKLVERAKGILMKVRGLGEEEAYQLLRKQAMQQQLRLAEVAERLISAADLLAKT